jgi:DNA-binding XRE family transcriptional regulator
MPRSIRSRLDYANGRQAQYVGRPGEHHIHTRTPRLKELREQAGITDEQAAELLKEQTHGLGTLQRLEAGVPMPNIVAARVCAALNINYAAAKGVG